MSSPSKPLPEQAATEKSTGEMSTKQGKTDPGWTSYYGPETKRSKRERRRPSLLDLSANDISDSSQTSSKPFLGSVPNPTPTDPRINHPYYNKAASNTKYEASHGTPKVALPGLPTQYPQRPAVPVYGRSFLPGHSVFPNYTFPPGLSQRDHFGFGSPTQPLQSYPTGNPFSYPSMHFPQPPTAYANIDTLSPAYPVGQSSVNWGPTASDDAISLAYLVRQPPATPFGRPVAPGNDGLAAIGKQLKVEARELDIREQAVLSREQAAAKLDEAVAKREQSVSQREKAVEKNEVAASSAELQKKKPGMPTDGETAYRYRGGGRHLKNLTSPKSDQHTAARQPSARDMHAPRANLRMVKHSAATQAEPSDFDEPQHSPEPQSRITLHQHFANMQDALMNDKSNTAHTTMKGLDSDSDVSDSDSTTTTHETTNSMGADPIIKVPFMRRKGDTKPASSPKKPAVDPNAKLILRLEPAESSVSATRPTSRTDISAVLADARCAADQNAKTPITYMYNQKLATWVKEVGPAETTTTSDPVREEHVRADKVKVDEKQPADGGQWRSSLSDEFKANGQPSGSKWARMAAAANRIGTFEDGDEELEEVTGENANDAEDHSDGQGLEPLA